MPAGDPGGPADGSKELVALADGFGESAQAWVDQMRPCKRRGMRGPVLAVGGGALGFCKAVRDLFPEAGKGAQQNQPPLTLRHSRR